jgi:translation initiation factor IF-3
VGGTPGCKDLIDVLEGKHLKKFLDAKLRVNGKIRASSVRVIEEDGKVFGVLPIADALRLSQSRGLDLVEISSNTKPPVCRIVDFGKYLSVISKKRKKKDDHAA